MAWMLYGANGYTGQLVAKLAVERGERPVLAGRSAEKLAPIAAELDLDQAVIDLTDPEALRAVLADFQVVLHCAGPFSSTSAPMVDACLATGTHYVDITGEIDVFEAIYARDDEAKTAGVVLLPGAGFDVVPTDCAAAMLGEALPDAVELELAFSMGGGISPGTVKSAIEGAAAGGRARIAGALQTVPIGHRRVTAEFPSGPKMVTAIPWGDLSSAYRSTGIPTITTYTVVPGGDLVSGAQQLFGPLLRMPSVSRAGNRLVERFLHGPSEERQARGHTEVWGKVHNLDGKSATVALTTPAGYAFTADSVLVAVKRLIEREIPAGAHTPSSAFGSAFVGELDGVRLDKVRTR
jgi:saccharopine dehydrogenase (NAD+, L-lysine-forming)